MSSVQMQDKDLKVLNETITNHGKLNIKIARKARQNEKPRLYKKVQNILSIVRTSLAEDVIEERNN